MIEDVGVTLLRNFDRVDLNFRRIRCGRKDGTEDHDIGYLTGVRSRAASSRSFIVDTERLCRSGGKRRIAGYGSLRWCRGAVGE